MTTASPHTSARRVLRSFVLIGAVAVSLIVAAGCSKDDAPETSTAPAANTDTAEPEKPRKTSIIGAPIQKAEDVRDLSDERQKALLEQIENN